MNYSDTLNRLHRDVYALIDKALGEQDHESANWSLSLAECLGHKVLEAYPADAEACYLIALTWYHRWLAQAERRRCLFWLQKTLELAPTHPWAPLYMGYQYWDDGQYIDAFRELARVDQAYFASIEHHWRNIKTRELMLCCRVLGDFPPVEIASLQQLVADYLAADTVDRPIPTELIRTLSSPVNRERFDVAPRAVAAEMCRLIEGIGDQNVFPGQLAEFQSQCDSRQYAIRRRPYN